MKLSWRIIPILLITILTSCHVGPDYHPPSYNLPTHYLPAKNRFSTFRDEQWWQNLQDPILVNLIFQALQGNNLDIEKSRALVRQARAALGVAGADFYPQVNLIARISRDHLSSNSEILGSIPSQIIPVDFTDYRAGFDASWELDFFGRIRSQVKGATARLQSAVENQRDIMITTAAEVARVYTTYRVYQMRVLTAKNTLDSYEKTAKLVKLQLKAGVASDVDLRRVESEVQSSKAAIQPLAAEAKASLFSLAVLVGEYPESLNQRIAKMAAIPRFLSKKLAMGLPSDLVKRRPDIRKAERDLAASTADLGVSIANLYPRFQLLGIFGQESIFPGAFFDAASRYWSIAPQLTFPIFQGGRLRSQVKESEAVLDIALATYKQTVLQALSDVESAVIRYHREYVRMQNLNASYEKLKSTLHLIQLQYRSGKASLIDVLDVERQMYQIRDQYVQSQGQVTINLVSLYKALGGGWNS